MEDMDIAVPDGKYVVAVSGGVDSIVLLHTLVTKALAEDAVPGTHYVVAHFDHGIRPESIADRQFVQQLAREHRLPFIYERVELGAHASEATARAARYAFLEKVRRASGARGIMTAHHEDDFLETAIINLVRGTTGRGLHALKSTESLQRPLLGISKRKLVEYAKINGLTWREDATNTNEAILRNYIRHRYVAGMGKTRRTQLLRISQQAAEISREIDELVTAYLHVQPSRTTVGREGFRDLPVEVAREVMAAWLRRETAGFQVTRKMLDRLVLAAQTGRTGTRHDVMNGYRLEITKNAIELKQL